MVTTLFKSVDIKKLVGSSAVPGLNRNDLYSQKVAVPKNEDEQKQIAEIISAVDEKISINKKLKNKLTLLKKGLMQDLLSGSVIIRFL